MEATKKKSLEAAYERIINVGLCIAPYEDLSDLTASDVMLFGTTKDEKVFSFNDLDLMFKSQYKQMADMVPSLDRKRLFMRIAKDGNNAFIAEEVTLTISSPQETNTILIRCSCVMEYIDSQWKLTHWHASTPVDTENDHWHKEEWKREKEKLQKLVDQQTADLQGKNKELKIEAALEKVRSVAMGMRRPEDMLKVASEISTQLQQFGIDNIRNIQTAIIEKEEGIYLCYQYFTPYDKEIIERTEYLKNPVEQKMVTKMLRSQDNHFLGILQGAELDEFRSHRKIENHFPDPLLDQVKKISYCFLSIGQGGLGLTLYGAMEDKNLILFKRFHQVFSLAYGRFRDIQKAEEQARESEVQLALERVRARTMAMRNSDELAEASSLLFQQMEALGVSTYSSGFTIWDEDQDELISWMCNADGSMNPPFRMPLAENRWHNEQYEYWKNEKDLAVKDFTGEEMQSYFRYLRSFPLLDEAFKKSIAAGHPMPERQLHHVANFSHGNLLFITLEPCPKAHELFKRFAKVFEQTYTRFLDLQQAEEQAREAEIQLALERVRARTMAMHNSEELGEVAAVMFEQISSLTSTPDRFNICIANKEDKSFDVFVTDQSGFKIKNKFNAKAKNSPVIAECFETWKNDAAHLIQDIHGKELENWIRYMGKVVGIPFKMENVKKHRFLSSVFFSHGFIGITTHSQPQETTINLIERFAKVFQQTYTRFLDLKKAEAQARESEIQLALERVRAKSMAMHQSDELADLSLELVKQVHALGIDTWFCAFNIYDDHPEGSIEWGSNGQGTFPRYRTPREGVFLNYYEAGQRGETLLINEIGEDECPAHYDYLCSLPGVGEQLLKMKDEGIPFPTSQIDHVAFFKYGYIIFITFEPAPEAHDIFKRFAKVFQQTYTRFLDLQKSEEQAKESQVEAALERVRSRSLAMHKTNELQDVVRVVAEELKNTGLILDTGGAVICTYFQDSRDVIHWTATDDPAYPSVPYLLPYFEDKLFDEAWESKSRGDNYFAKVFSYDVKNAFFNHAFDHSDYRQLPDEYKKIILESKSHGLAWAWAENSAIMIPSIQGELPSEEERKILIRFAKVFEQAYTRFLDLQKAEAQAREAQIQLALERVRARTMAMHNSEELKEVIQVVYDQFVGLNINVEHAGFILDYRKRDDMHIWLADHQQGVPSEITIPYFDSPHWNSYLEAKAKGQNLFTNQLDFEEKNRFYKDLIALIPAMPEETIQSIFNKPGLTISTVLLDNVGLYIENYSGTPFTTDENSMLMRFGKVFQQTYTRFLDLQKAEALAREARIEASLEKVRAQSMGMQTSDDLSKVASVMFDQMKSLGGDLFAFGIVLCNKDKDTVEQWHNLGNEGMIEPFTVPVNLDYIHQYRYDQWKAGEELFSIEIPEDYIAQHFNLMFELPTVIAAMEEVADQGVDVEIPDWEIDYGASFTYGYLLVSSRKPFEETHIFPRFAKAFDQAYTRFLDLQKAEEQGREAQVNLAVERVRARALAMFKSEEILEVVYKLKEEIMGLNIPNVTAATIHLKEPDGRYRAWDLTSINEEGNQLEISLDIRWHREDTHPDFFMREVWDRTEDYFVVIQGGDRYQHTVEWLHQNGHSEHAEEFEQFLETSQLEQAYHPTVPLNNGRMCIDLLDRPSPEIESILKKMGGAFDLAYKRFEDLQKAEAQAREAEIQLALERVRARSMAMHKSEELLDVITVVSEQLHQLNFRFNHVSFANNDLGRDYRFWSSLKGMNPVRFNVPFADITVFTSLKAAQQKSVHFYTDIITQKENRKWHEHLLQHGGSEIFSEEINEYIMERGMARSISINPNIILILANYASVPYSEEENKIIARFSRVFEQSYTRFLDLQKAEEQAREARIETSLEKVRSRTMGMQSSEELPEVANLLFLEVQALGIPAWSCGYCILMEDRKSSTCIMSSEGTLQKPFLLPFNGEVSFEEWNNFVKSDQIFFTQELGGKAIESHYNFMKSLPQLGPIFKEIEEAGLSLPTYQINHLCKFTHGFLLFITYEPVPDAHDIFKRFSRVFDQTYTRFLDLKKAEAQTREAQIENALEKVRSRSLAMRHPNELVEVAQLLREEMGALGVEELETSSIYIQDDISGLTHCWFTIKDADNPGNSVTDQMSINLQDSWVGRQMHKFYGSGKDRTSILMKGDHRIEWIRYCEEKSDLFGKSEFYGQSIPERTYHLSKFSNGFLGAASPGDISEESWDLMKRATSVFSFAYTRFNDLQKAEENARRARQQASLDRVRADISSMRSAEDLDRVTPLIWNELTTLGIPFIRCGIFIIHHEEEYIEIYLSKPDGTSLAVMHLPFGSSELISQTVDAWQRGSVYTQHWTQEEFLEWGQSMMEQGQVPDLKSYQGAEEAPETLHLHFIPFIQGMLYVGSTEPLIDEEINLSESLAKAFSIAYARYEDFVKLEKAKAGIEDALTELKATQSQLVQQEKLASLGQLTAGIAHEIKNPLNFVNNFSEVSLELIQEALEEIRQIKTNEHADEARELLGDIQSNLSKIHQHGTRANAIVSSMLQHSRGGSGKMEPTNLNALIREYVNLAFHGMRAGKNPINVQMKFDLDESLGHVNLLGEDFSRVILNLANNGFDAMREKLKTNTNYAPLLIISTKLVGETVEIVVADNGPGIPDNIKNKILQPFFTTKKGTEGTGLGLSITHDIIKAHAGELIVETTINNGTNFRIKLKK